MELFVLLVTLIFPLFFIAVALLSVAVVIWSIVDIAKHWDSVEQNIVWLLGIILVGPIISVVYYFVVVQKRKQHSLTTSMNSADPSQQKPPIA